MILLSGGGGPWANAVFPRTGGMTCNEVCKGTTFTNCDGEVAINGILGQIKDSNLAGAYYNYGCTVRGNNGFDERQSKNEKIMGGAVYFHYCCCRH